MGDTLKTSIQGVRGGEYKRGKAACVKCIYGWTVITVDNYKGTSATYERREEPVIDITHGTNRTDAFGWTGTLTELLKIIKKHTDGNG